MYIFINENKLHGNKQKYLNISVTYIIIFLKMSYNNDTKSKINDFMNFLDNAKNVPIVIPSKNNTFNNDDVFLLIYSYYILIMKEKVIMKLIKIKINQYNHKILI